MTKLENDNTFVMSKPEPFETRSSADFIIDFMYLSLTFIAFRSSINSLMKNEEIVFKIGTFPKIIVFKRLSTRYSTVFEMVSKALTKPALELSI